MTHAGGTDTVYNDVEQLVWAAWSTRSLRSFRQSSARTSPRGVLLHAAAAGAPQRHWKPAIWRRLEPPPNGFNGIRSPPTTRSCSTARIRYCSGRSATGQCATPIVPVSSSFDGTTLELVYKVRPARRSTANGSNSNNVNRAATNDDPGFGNATLADLLNSGAVIERFYDTDTGCGGDPGWLARQSSVPTRTPASYGGASSSGRYGPVDDGGDAGHDDQTASTGCSSRCHRRVADGRRGVRRLFPHQHAGCRNRSRKSTWKRTWSGPIVSTVEAMQQGAGASRPLLLAWQRSPRSQSPSQPTMIQPATMNSCLVSRPAAAGADHVQYFTAMPGL